MAIYAEVAVLFTAPRNEIGLPFSEEHSAFDLARIEEADLHCWVSSTGQFEYRSYARLSPLVGEPSLEGRLWIGTLGRHWTPELSGYGGHPTKYAEALRSLAAIPGVMHVWYGVLTDDGGCGNVEAVTDEWVSAFFGVAQAA